MRRLRIASSLSPHNHERIMVKGPTSAAGRAGDSRMTRRLLILLLFAAATAARAQGPDAEWRTITTKHFRIHYPVAYEAWTKRAASRIESVRDAVVVQVGFDPQQVTDVLVENPVASANGETLPLLDAPR